MGRIRPRPGTQMVDVTGVGGAGHLPRARFAGMGQAAGPVVAIGHVRADGPHEAV
jgi:hypothetical protein